MKKEKIKKTNMETMDQIAFSISPQLVAFFFSGTSSFRMYISLSNASKTESE